MDNLEVREQVENLLWEMGKPDKGHEDAVKCFRYGLRLRWPERNYPGSGRESGRDQQEDWVTMGERKPFRDGYQQFEKTLVTKSQYDQLTPIQQGYAQYWQGGWPGSELRGLRNPYRRGTAEHSQWSAGQALAAQDEEDNMRRGGTEGIHGME